MKRVFGQRIINQIRFLQMLGIKIVRIWLVTPTNKLLINSDHMGQVTYFEIKGVTTLFKKMTSEYVFR